MSKPNSPENHRIPASPTNAQVRSLYTRCSYWTRASIPTLAVTTLSTKHFSNTAPYYFADVAANPAGNTEISTLDGWLLER